ncbi:MAG: AtpZ/AtpI family protein [Thermomicrobiales bacterium]|nr:AtpZ/AtpI family protein [Thermomicrobiales bacterium]
MVSNADPLNCWESTSSTKHPNRGERGDPKPDRDNCARIPVLTAIGRERRARIEPAGPEWAAAHEREGPRRIVPTFEIVIFFSIGTEVRRAALKNLPSTAEERRQLGAAGTAVGLGCSIVTSIILFIGGGIALDRWLDTSPIFTLIGVALGLVLAGYQLYELAQIGRTDRAPGAVTRRIQKLPTSRRK